MSALLTAGLFLVVTFGWLPATGPVDYYNVCVIETTNAATICEQAYDGPKHTVSIPYEWQHYTIKVQACMSTGVCGEWSEALTLSRNTNIKGDVNGDGAIGVADQAQEPWGTTDTNRFTVCTPVKTEVK